MNRPRSFALLLAATAMATLWAGPAQAADPPAATLVMQPPTGYVRATSPDSNGPLDLEKAVQFLGNDEETRKDLRADEFTGGHVATYTKGETVLLSAVFVFKKEIPGDEFVSDAKEGLNEGGTKTTEFDTGLPDAIGVSTGAGAEQTHVVLFAKRHHAFLDILAGPDGTQQQLLAAAKAHHARLTMLEPAAEEGNIPTAIAGVLGIGVVVAIVALVVAKVRGRKAAPALAADWNANAPTWGAPGTEGGQQWGSQPPPGGEPGGQQWGDQPPPPGYQPPPPPPPGYQPPAQ